MSKAPCTSEALENINLGASTVLPDHAKYFLFAGTKIVRARKPQFAGDMGDVGLAMVVRTGFNTTKGALVRSMLFPKPSGFKFYRDSFHYIGVMAGIAACGFVASFINFVRLGVSILMLEFMGVILMVFLAAMAPDFCEGTRSYHYCCSASTSGYVDNWDKLCSLAAKDEENLLYQSSKVVSFLSNPSSHR